MKPLRIIDLRPVNTPEKLSEWMFMNIQPGYVDRFGKKVPGAVMNSQAPQEFRDKYVLQPPSRLICSRVGTCFDQVEFARLVFNRVGIPCASVLIVQDLPGLPSHAFIIFERKGGQFYWFENANYSCAGIKGPYRFEVDIIEEVHAGMRRDREDKGNWEWEYYEKPPSGCSLVDFYKSTGFEDLTGRL